MSGELGAWLLRVMTETMSKCSLGRIKNCCMQCELHVRNVCMFVLNADPLPHLARVC